MPVHLPAVCVCALLVRPDVAPGWTQIFVTCARLFQFRRCKCSLCTTVAPRTGPPCRSLRPWVGLQSRLAQASAPLQRRGFNPLKSAVTQQGAADHQAQELRAVQRCLP